MCVAMHCVHHVCNMGSRILATQVWDRVHHSHHSLCDFSCQFDPNRQLSSSHPRLIIPLDWMAWRCRVPLRGYRSPTSNHRTPPCFRCDPVRLCAHQIRSPRIADAIVVGYDLYPIVCLHAFEQLHIVGRCSFQTRQLCT